MIATGVNCSRKNNAMWKECLQIALGNWCGFIWFRDLDWSESKIPPWPLGQPLRMQGIKIGMDERSSLLEFCEKRRAVVHFHSSEGQ